MIDISKYREAAKVGEKFFKEYQTIIPEMNGAGCEPDEKILHVYLDKKIKIRALPKKYEGFIVKYDVTGKIILL